MLASHEPQSPHQYPPTLKMIPMPSSMAMPIQAHHLQTDSAFSFCRRDDDEILCVIVRDRPIPAAVCRDETPPIPPDQRIDKVSPRAARDNTRRQVRLKRAADLAAMRESSSLRQLLSFAGRCQHHPHRAFSLAPLTSLTRFRSSARTALPKPQHPPSVSSAGSYGDHG